MSNPLAVTLHALAAETASGTSSVLDLGTVRNALRLVLSVEAITASTGITVRIETSPSGTGGWRVVSLIAAVTAIGNVEQSFGTLQRFVRATWTITGATPSVSFSLSGEAHVTYAKTSDIGSIGIASEALASVSVHDKTEALLAATDTADRYLCREFTLPLVSWGNDLRRMVTHIVVYDLMCVRGFQPEGADALIVKRYDDAIAALREVGEGKACMPGIVDTDDGDTTGSGDGDYDVATLEPGIFFGEYPFGEDAEASS